MESRKSDRKLEKIIGVELAITLALGWSIYNGIGGFIGNFGLEDSLISLISLPLILIILIWFIFSLIKTVRRVNDKVRYHELRFLIIHIILVIIGYMVSLNPTMSYANWFLILVYTALLLAGGVVFILRFRATKN